MMGQVDAEVLFGLTLIVTAFPRRVRVLAGCLLLVMAVIHENGWLQ